MLNITHANSDLKGSWHT